MILNIIKTINLKKKLTTYKVNRVPGICWFTNLNIKRRNEELFLYKKYIPENYPKYDNYEAINVNKTSDIPYDYDDVMGVPITFINKYCPKQFEIIGLIHPKLNNKFLYARLLIKKIKN